MLQDREREVVEGQRRRILMGGHWITCPKCKMTSRFPHDFMWFDEKGRVHDLNQWRCKNSECRMLFKKAEGKAFDKHMKKEQEKFRREREEKVDGSPDRG